MKLMGLSNDLKQSSPNNPLMNRRQCAPLVLNSASLCRTSVQLTGKFTTETEVICTSA